MKALIKKLNIYKKNGCVVAFFVLLCKYNITTRAYKKKQLQVHFTYNVNGAEVQDFCVVQSKTKRLSCATQLMTAFNLSKQLNVSAKDITLTHYYVC